MREDYQSLKAATYKESLVKGIDYYLEMIRKVRFTDPAMLSRHRNWIITNVTGNLCTFLNDESAFKCYSLIYRMGPVAANQLRSYLDKAKKELQKS